MSAYSPASGLTRPVWRRALYALLAAVAALFLLLPRPYVARARIVVQDSGASNDARTGMLGPALGSAQSVGSLLTGGSTTSELHLILARSDAVKAETIHSLQLVGPARQFGSERDALLWLDRSLDVQLLPGGVLQVETVLRDSDSATRLTATYVEAVSRRFAQFGRERSEKAVVQVIDPAAVSPERPYDVRAAAALAAVVLLALFTEWYAPATGLLGPARHPKRPEEFA